MFFALGAASTALDAIQSLTSSGSSTPSSSQPAGGFTPFDIAGSSPTSGSAGPAPSWSNTGSQVSPAMMSALIAAQGQASTGATASASTSPAAALQNLFSQIDGNGDGQISQSEFENALGAGGTNLAQADKVFNELDTNGDGSVSLSELSSALQGASPAGAGSSDSASGAGSTAIAVAPIAVDAGGANSNPLLQALAGASSSTVSNSNGSTTTSVTYADGSQVTMTTPATTSTSSSSATSSYNLLEQLIQRQASLISFSAASLSLNA
jgi:hypothetical protein